MLKKWIYDTTITLQDSVENWPQALELCAKPLMDLQVIEPEYVTAIIQQHHALGPYYVLAPGVSFGAGEFDPVDVIIMLAAPDKHSHIEMISALAELFSSDEDMEKLHQANTLEEIKTIIDRF